MLSVKNSNFNSPRQLSEAPTADTTQSHFMKFKREMNTPSPTKLMRHKLKLSNAGDNIMNTSCSKFLNKNIDENCDNYSESSSPLKRTMVRKDMFKNSLNINSI